MPRKTAMFFLLAPVMLFVLLRSQATFSQSAQTLGEISGRVTSAEGKPLEGIGLSARGVSDSYTTTVYTDDSGRYLFPALPSGQYKIWAQAVGFETFKTEATISDTSKKKIDIKLATLADFHKQLSGTEWAESLPEDTPDDRRMKTVFINNCSGCHQVSFLLQNRFDAAGWAL